MEISLYDAPNTTTLHETGRYLAVVVKIISDRQRQTFTFVNTIIICPFVSVTGTATNIINLAIFYKQGLNTTINISFFAMAISDLCSLLLQLWYILCVSSVFENSSLPMVLTEVQYLTAGVPREAFARITCLITVYIAAERCLCIAFPLHVKQMITTKRTTAVIVSIYCGTWLSGVPLYCTSYIGWKFYPNKNRTLLGLLVRNKNHAVEGIVYIIHAFFGILTFLAIVVLTLVLIRRLGQKSECLKGAHLDKLESHVHRERRTMSMVVLIAGILIICYTPAVLLCVTTFYEPEFSRSGRYFNIYYSLWSLALLFENINSSVNIFLYFRMSTKYRQTFRELFFRYRRSV